MSCVRKRKNSRVVLRLFCIENQQNKEHSVFVRQTEVSTTADFSAITFRLFALDLLKTRGQGFGRCELQTSLETTRLDGNLRRLLSSPLQFGTFLRCALSTVVGGTRNVYANLFPFDLDVCSQGREGNIGPISAYLTCPNSPTSPRRRFDDYFGGTQPFWHEMCEPSGIPTRRLKLDLTFLCSATQIESIKLLVLIGLKSAETCRFLFG